MGGTRHWLAPAIAWVFTALSIGLSVWTFGPYDPQLAVLTATLIALIWYSYYTARLASLTKQSISLAEATSKRELRAYLGIRSLLLEDYDATPRADVTVINAGRTPALDVTASLTFSLLPYPPPSPLPMRSPVGRSRASVAAGGALNIRPRLINPLSDAERTAVANGNGIILVYGEFRYRDIFGDDHTLTIKFACGGPYGAPPPDKHMIVCEDGNKSD